MSAFSPQTRNAAIAVWNYVFPKLPGTAIFKIAGDGVIRKAWIEFIVVLGFAVLPLGMVIFTNVLSSSDATIFSEFGRYTKAGEIFFYVGPIIGSSVYLLATEFRRNLNGSQFAYERVWFLGFSIVALILSSVMLVVHHLDKTGNPNALRYFSYVIYVVSLYFSFLQYVYSNFEGKSSEIGDKAPPQEAVNAGLAGFNGEAA